MSCEIFANLNEALDEKRNLWGRRVKLLVLRPPGDLRIQLPASEFIAIISHLLQNSTETGANSICFAAVVRDQELWLTMTDNGWGFPITARGLKPAQYTLLSIGGTLDLMHPKRGSEVILKIPLVQPAAGYSVDLNNASVLESHI